RRGGAPGQRLGVPAARLWPDSHSTRSPGVPRRAPTRRLPGGPPGGGDHVTCCPHRRSTILELLWKTVPTARSISRERPDERGERRRDLGAHAPDPAP